MVEQKSRGIPILVNLLRSTRSGRETLSLSRELRQTVLEGDPVRQLVEKMRGTNSGGETKVLSRELLRVVRAQN